MKMQGYVFGTGAWVGPITLERAPPVQLSIEGDRLQLRPHLPEARLRHPRAEVRAARDAGGVGRAGSIAALGAHRR